MVRAAGAKLAPGPYRWITQFDLTHLHSLAGFPVELRDLSDCALAAQARVGAMEARADGGLRCDGRARELRGSLGAARELQEQRAFDWRHWYAEAHSQVLVRAWRSLRDLGIGRARLEDALARGVARPWPTHVAARVQSGFQRAILASLPRAQEAELEARIRHKLQRWRLPGLPPRVARLVLRRLRSLKGAVQPRARAAALRVLWNGLITYRRFQQGRPWEGCRLGCQPPAGSDAIEHYASCPRLQSVARTSLGLDLPVEDFRRSFCLAAPCADERALRARWCKMAVLHYVLHRVLCAAKHHPQWRPLSMAAPALRQAIREAVHAGALASDDVKV